MARRVGVTAGIFGLAAGVMMISANAAADEPRWLEPGERLEATGHFGMIALPAGSAPSTVAIADDGTLWVTLSGADAIAEVQPDGSGLAVHPLPHPGSSPRVIALGADGNMWFSEHQGNRIGRITPGGDIAGFRLPSEASQPRAVARGADGHLWVGLFAAGRIARVTPAGKITEFTLPTPDSGPRAIAAGPDGNLWFSQFRAGTIGRITPAGDVVEFELPRPNAGPGDITAGADGAMWFVELAGTMDGLRPDGNRVGRITMEGEVTEFPLPSDDGTPINLAVGPDRNIWYTKGGRLGRVTPAGEITEFAIPGGGRAVGVSAGSDREPPTRLTDRLWFTDGAGDRLGYMLFE